MYKSFDDLDIEVQKAIKSKPIRDRKYLDSFLGGCCMFHKAKNEGVCGHHLIHGVQRGDRKASDCFVIPVCFKCHTEIHKNEPVFLEKWGIEYDVREMAFYRYKEWMKRHGKN